GNAYVTGHTDSPNFPTASPLQPFHGSDAFVAKLNAAGSALLYSTYLGGRESDDQGSAIAVDDSGNAYVTGGTNSKNFPTANPLQPVIGGDNDNAFIAKISSGSLPECGQLGFTPVANLLTIRILMGLAKADQGAARIFGIAPGDDDSGALLRRRIGF